MVSMLFTSLPSRFARSDILNQIRTEMGKSPFERCAHIPESRGSGLKVIHRGFVGDVSTCCEHNLLRSVQIQKNIFETQGESLNSLAGVVRRYVLEML